jgi:hypothetical protein
MYGFISLSRTKYDSDTYLISSAGEGNNQSSGWYMGIKREIKRERSKEESE